MEEGTLTRPHSRVGRKPQGSRGTGPRVSVDVVSGVHRGSSTTTRSRPARGASGTSRVISLGTRRPYAATDTT